MGTSDGEPVSQKQRGHPLVASELFSLFPPLPRCRLFPMPSQRDPVDLCSSAQNPLQLPMMSFRADPGSPLGPWLLSPVTWPCSSTFIPFQPMLP